MVEISVHGVPGRREAPDPGAEAPAAILSDRPSRKVIAGLLSGLAGWPRRWRRRRTVADFPASRPGRAGAAPTPHEALVRSVADGRVDALFQPVVDLRSASVVGYEVLAQGPEELRLPASLFEAAACCGMAWELERACYVAALRRIAGLPQPLRSERFFLNVSREAFDDPRFVSDFVLSLLRGNGLDQRSFVMEITERGAIADPQRFEAQLRHYAEQGFSIALDGLSGTSGLVTLATTGPQYLKVDASLTRGLHLDQAKRQLVRALVAFANAAGSKVIAEGIESWAELEALLAAGVPLGQGHLLAAPALQPPRLADSVEEEVLRVARRAIPAGDVQEHLDRLIQPAQVIGTETIGEEVDVLFRERPDLEHLVVVDEGRPVGLITRTWFQGLASGPVGYPLIQLRPARRFANHHMLEVSEATAIPALTRLAMGRPAHEVYDPVLVLDATGRLRGTVSMRQLIVRSMELEVAAAQDANPLTGLPGNARIERWIAECLATRDGCVLYADLDRFKEYNDTHGFLYGDELIRLAARVLQGELEAIAPGARLGHVGGDDFVVVTGSPPEEAAIARACARFDRERLAFFAEEEARSGCFQAADRRGEIASVPIVTLSVAVIPVDRVGRTSHPGALSELAASLKRKVKELSLAERRSSFLVERRRGE
jgi:EAL domain-containing protein (putative c-di-GMP-specific phosphodiesterase class I)/GGDEF domain-containing protein